VFFGTTNSDKGYLRDITGNRRFWTVKTPGSAMLQTWQMTPFEVSQIWAEAIVYVKAGEKLFLNADLEELAKSEQREAMEQDEREGLIRAYLDRLLPENWPEMSVLRPADFIRSPEDPTQPRGCAFRNAVAIWRSGVSAWASTRKICSPKTHMRLQRLWSDVKAGLKRGSSTQSRCYGRQRIYER
jgi:predicted P-loop ATPase